MRKLLLLTLIPLIVATVSGCSYLRATEAKNSGYLPRGELLEEQRSRAPFHGYWVFNEDRYQTLREERPLLYVAPVDTTYVEKIYKASSGSEKTKRARIQEAEELAFYFREKIRLVLDGKNAMKSTLFRWSDEPKEDALQLNLALVQVIPTKPGVNLVGTAAGFFVPGGGLIKIAGEGSVAMEGFVSEPIYEPEEAYEQFKDREGQKLSAFSFKDYRRYSHIRVALDEWAEQIVELLNTPADHKVDDGDLIAISPL